MPEKRVNTINNMKQTHILRSHKIYNKTFKNKNIHKGGAHGLPSTDNTVGYLLAKLTEIQKIIKYFDDHITNIITLLLQETTNRTSNIRVIVNPNALKSLLSNFNTYLHASELAIQTSYDFIDIILVFVSILNNHVTKYDNTNIQLGNSKTGPESIITQLEEIITLIT